MTELLVRGSEAVADSKHLGYVGQDAHRTCWAWLTPESCQARPGDRVEVPEERLLQCPADVPVNRVLTLLGYWPAWRVTQWARLEIGSGVLIVWSGTFAKQVADLCRCRGALWCGVWGASPVGANGEFWLPVSGERQPGEILRALPRQPDSVLVLGGGVHELMVAIAICRDLGTVVVAVPPGPALDLNFYPDVHRRGLTIRAGSPFEYGPGDAKAWNHAARRINTLIGSGLLTPSHSVEAVTQLSQRCSREI